MADIIRVAVVQHEGLLRSLLATGLAAQPSIEVVGCFSSAAEAMVGIPLTGADAVTLDIELGDGSSGIDVGLALRRVMPDLAVILLSGHDRSEGLDTLPAGQRSKWSYLLKTSVRDIKSFVEMIECTVRGVPMCDPAPQLESKGQAEERTGLTGRQADVLALLAEGYSNAGIGRKLVLTEKSVQNYVSRLYQQLGIRADNRMEHPRILALNHYLHCADAHAC